MFAAARKKKRKRFKKRNVAGCHKKLGLLGGTRTKGFVTPL